MAYAFSKVDELVGEEGSTNIFGQDQGMLQQGGQQAPPGSDMVKTTTEGDISRADGGGAGGDDVLKADDPTPADQSQVFKMNVGKTETPGGISRIGDKIQQNQQLLQDRANEYQDQYKEKYQYDIGQGDLNKAIEGDRDQYGNVSGLFAKQQADYRPEFEGAEDLYVDQMKYLDNQAGLQKLAAEGQGPRYTQGMSAFDVMLMQRDPAFTQLVGGIKGQNVDLEKQLGERPDQLEAEAQEYGQGQLEGAKTKAEQYLSNYQTDLQKQNEAEAAAYNKQLQELDRDKIISDALAEASIGAGKDLRQVFSNRDYDTSVAPYLNPANIDASKYASFDEGGYGYRDFVDGGEAERFNNLLGLLGDGGEMYSAAQGPGDQYSLDKTGMLNALFQDALTARQAQDEVQLGSAAALRKAAQERADADDARRLGLVESYDTDLDALTNELLNEDKALGQYFTESMMSDYKRPGEQLDLNWDHALNSQEAEQLNAIAKDLGLADVYQAGEYASGGPESLIDRDDYKTYLFDKMKKHKAQLQANAIENAGGTPQIQPDGTVIDLNPPLAPQVGSLIINDGSGGNLPVLPSNPRGLDPFEGQPQIVLDQSPTYTSPEEAMRNAATGALPSWFANIQG